VIDVAEPNADMRRFGVLEKCTTHLFSSPVGRLRPTPDETGRSE
jgi:hypothetical protein